ncbi:MAG: phosphatase PAP2 family protein [Eubacterium sp.]|nr:phosphatase PAP2 family protein [Eubacterium sp.]MBQ3412889.1 phosphatase PAP2 family protein [Oscillospiraceae bacterium]
MDIEILLALQNFRVSINDALTPFMEMISLFAVTYLVIAPAVIYWCVDKKAGLYSLASYYSCIAVNAVVKLTVCAYRPWIRDERILPAGDAIRTATGYSFPSGHSSTASPIYGSMAVKAWKKLRWISVLCLICVLLTGFSRLYLGVHTPQDVLVGLSLGAIAVFCMDRLFRYLGKHPDKENMFLIGGIVFGVASILYITLKPYPMDYVDGKLLVDPVRMMKDGYGDIGAMIAFCIGRLIEKTWVNYEPSATKEELAASAAGAVILFFLIANIGDPLKSLLGIRWGQLAASSIEALFITAAWPAVLKKVKAGQKEEKAQTA